MKTLLRLLKTAGRDCVIAIAVIAVVAAQTSYDISTQDTDKLITILDHVTEQNSQLEQQNRDLMEQLGVLLNTPTAPSDTSPDITPPEKYDAASMLGASEGKPGVFRTFNPCRGFTIAEEAPRMLSMNGHLAARYFKRPPLWQIATDHLGHPKDFLFGGNYCLWNMRNLRPNVRLMNVDRSPVGSTFSFSRKKSWDK